MQTFNSLQFTVHDSEKLLIADTKQLDTDRTGLDDQFCVRSAVTGAYSYWLASGIKKDGQGRHIYLIYEPDDETVGALPLSGWQVFIWLTDANTH